MRFAINDIEVVTVYNGDIDYSLHNSITRLDPSMMEGKTSLLPSLGVILDSETSEGNIFVSVFIAVLLFSLVGYFWWNYMHKI